MSYIFDQKSFAVFEVDGVDQRMEAVRSNIQPSFDHFGNLVAQFLQEELKLEATPFVHIAKHLRRTVYPVESTWCAIGGDKRGYKKYPHFQIGINEDYLFFMLSFIDNIEHKSEIAQSFKENIGDFENLPVDYVMIPDHTKLDYQFIKDMDLASYFDRLRKVKKTELMIGRIVRKDEASSFSTEDYATWLEKTTQDLIPFYIQAMNLF